MIYTLKGGNFKIRKTRPVTQKQRKQANKQIEVVEKSHWIY